MGRISSEKRSAASELQESIIDSLKVIEPKIATNEVMDTFSKCSDEQLEKVFGDKSAIMKRFIGTANPNHPEILKMTSETRWQQMSKDVSEGVTNLGEKYGDLILSVGRSKPRLFLDAAKRKEIRSSKRYQHNIWDQSCQESDFNEKRNDFLIYARYGIKYIQQEADYLKTQVEFFNKRDMPRIAQKIGTRSVIYTDMQKNEYFGFQKIKLAEAAAILAKLHGFKWNYSNPFSGNISISYKYFDKILSWEREIDPAQEERKAWHKAKSVGMSFTYEVRLYPLEHFISIIPSVPPRVKSILESIDRLSEGDGYPLFDFFWVAVPSIDVEHYLINDGKKFSFIYDGCTHRYENKEETVFGLDKILVSENYILPVLIGEKAERDGNCYFISMWY